MSTIRYSVQLGKVGEVIRDAAGKVHTLSPDAFTRYRARLDLQIPVCIDHNPQRQVGVCRSLWLAGDKFMCDIEVNADYVKRQTDEEIIGRKVSCTIATHDEREGPGGSRLVGADMTFDELSILSEGKRGASPGARVLSRRQYAPSRPTRPSEIAATAAARAASAGVSEWTAADAANWRANMAKLHEEGIVARSRGEALHTIVDGETGKEYRIPYPPKDDGVHRGCIVRVSLGDDVIRLR